MKPILYKIHYAEPHGLVYIGRTTQPLQARLRGHFFKKQMHREIDIFSVVKIEYAELPTVADMYCMEVIEINRHKPHFNRDDKASDTPTIEYPTLEYKPFECRLMDKWKAAITEGDVELERLRKAKIQFDITSSEMRMKWHNGEITEDEYFDFRERGLQCLT